ncbi:MAG: MerR family transcriptional regulator [bacterium]|nr:MerR family transcriptional regulator [bacterium]
MNRFNNKNELVSIGETAKKLGVSHQTLRRWDKSGSLLAVRAQTGGNRYYRRYAIESFIRKTSMKLLFDAELWVSSPIGYEPHGEVYCPNSGVFQARIGRMELLLMKMSGFEELYSIITSTAGEIGNNSFDHNLVNWPDISGIYFSFDLEQRYIILADRGQGILTTLKRVRPTLATDGEALRLAFTETISGRAPERRGNGLKYVRNNIIKYPLTLLFRSGDAELQLAQNENDLTIIQAEQTIRGCLAVITF